MKILIQLSFLFVIFCMSVNAGSDLQRIDNYQQQVIPYIDENVNNNIDNNNNFIEDKKYYTVDDQGRVDKQTYNGWRRFGVCSGCHGPNATGGTSGPNLLLAIKSKRIDFAGFKKIISKGRLEKGMPAWENDPNVNKYYDNIYGYLRARSDGAIKAGGRPKKIPK